MSATQHLIPNQHIYPSPPLTANHHERGAHLPDQNQNQAPKRIAEIPPHLVEIYMDPSTVKVPSSVLAAMNHASQPHPPASFSRQAPLNGSGQSNKAPLPPAPEQRKHLQRRPSSPNQSTHFSYDGPHQQEPATPSEPRPPTQNRTQSDPNVYRDARHQPPPQSVLMQPAHPPPHHQLPRSHPHHQPHQPGPSQAQQAQQHQVALMRQQELKRLSLASAGAPPGLLPPASITSPTAGAAPTPGVNGNGPPTAGPASAHPDSHTPPNTNGAPNPDQLVHTLIHHSAAQALAPVRPIFEQAWLETVTNVQREMGRMVSQFDDRYRGLEHDVNRLRGERNKAREEVNKMREDLLRMGERCDRYKEERNKLKDDLAHCGSIVKNSARDRQEMEDMRKEIFRLRNLLNEPRMEAVNRTPENGDNFPKRRLTEESYDDVDESFSIGQPRVEAREKQPSVPPKEEPSNREAHAQFHLEMEKMKEQMREQMQREIQIQMKDMLEKGIRNGEGSSGSASPATARLREVSLPAQSTSERAATASSSTRTSTTLPEASSDPKPDAEDMDVDQEDSVASGSPESLPPVDIETQFPSTMTFRGDQGQQPHANHASATLTGPVLQSHTPPHPHSTIPPSQSHRPSSSTSSPALIQGSLGRRGEGSDVSREMKEKHESVRPLTPSSPGSAFRSREIERPGSGLSGRGRSTNSTLVMPYQPFTGPPPEQERRRGDSSSRSRPATPRSNTAPTGLKSNETSPSSLPPPPPPPPQVPLNRPGSSSSSHAGASPGTSGAQFRKPYTAADGSPLARPRSTRFSSPVPMSDPECEGSARKRGRDEYEDGATSSHQRANTHPSDERARQRVKIEPTSDEQSRLRTLSPSSRAANTNNPRPVEYRESWSRVVPENLPPLQSPPLVDRKLVVHPPSSSKAAPTPTSATSSRPPNWELRSPLSPPATVQVQHWATAPSSQHQWRSEPRPGSSGGRTAVQFPFRKPLVTQNVNGQQQQQHRSPTSPTDGNGPSPKGKLSIKHLDLLYETMGEKYHCRVCKQPDSKDPQPPSTSPAVFPKNATWPDLAGHYENAHPKSCEDIEKLSAPQVAELKQQLKSSRFCGFVLS